jgi:predicted nuclease of restriction endonuclease-like (RecB) superfamily
MLTMTKKPMGINSDSSYRQFATGIAELLAEARRQAARSVNAILTATYWETGRRIVQFEQGGKVRAGYGEAVLVRLSEDLSRRFGRGFSVDHLELMRKFYLSWSIGRISESLIRKSSPSPTRISESMIRKLSVSDLVQAFPLSWTHYARLLRISNHNARSFYETEALRGGWSVRQLDRQIDSMFYERTALSRNKASMLKKGATAQRQDTVTPEEEIKDPYVLEFLGLKDEYSESDLEDALIQHLESFLLELGGDFTFVARQKRLRVGSEWYRVDLVFYHRRLRCLVLIDLKIGKFTHADAGQMHLYLNYAREHWTHREENPPVGLILCAAKDHDVAHYALENLPNKVLAAEYRTTLPDEKTIVREIRKTRMVLDAGHLDKDQLQ